LPTQQVTSQLLKALSVKEESKGKFTIDFGLVLA